MDATTVIAICGVVIAVASLGVSAYVAWATRKHNRLSVRPLLGLTATFPVGATAGLRLTNSGLGPARIVDSQLTFDGEQFGEFNKPNVDRFRDRLAIRPHVATLGGQPFLDTDYQQFLLNVDSYDPSEHREFRQVIEGKLRLEIKYESIYGEGFTVVYPRRGLVSSLPAWRRARLNSCSEKLEAVRAPRGRCSPARPGVRFRQDVRPCPRCSGATTVGVE